MARTPEQARAYYLRNREKILEQQRVYRAAEGRGKKREYYLGNRSRLLEQQRAYDAAHPKDPEREREYQRGYARRARAAAPEKYRVRARARYAQDPEKILDRNRDWRVRNRDGYLTSARASGLWQRHGMRSGDWAAMWDEQGGRCYLCGGELTADGAVIDHDHSCCPAGKSCRICRRGLAHHDCNITLGLVRDDVALLRRMADALEAAQMLVDQRKTEAGERLTLF